MSTPSLFDFEEISWSPHPTISGIEVKMFANEKSFSPNDILMAKVDPGGEIPWHVHERESEVGYTLQGKAVLYSAETEAREQAVETKVDAGEAFVIPPGTWHALVNTGQSDVLIFALHTP